MGVDDSKRSRFIAQIVQDAAKHDMLEYIGEIAGMEFMVVIHDGSCQLRTVARYQPICRVYATTLLADV